MDREIKLLISDEVKSPHGPRFTDRFVIRENDGVTVFHRYKSALIIPRANAEYGTTIVASNGKIIFGGRTVFDSFDSLTQPREFYYLKGSYFCVINWCYSEYYHFTKNAVQSILVALHEGFDLRENKVVIFENSPHYVYSYLHLLKECGYKVDWVEIPTEKITQCEEMVFAFPNNSLTQETVSYFSEFKSRVLKLHPIPNSLPRKIYVSRNDAKHKRSVINETEVMQVLTPLGFTAFKLAEFSVLENIQLFSQVEHVIFPHGAGGVHLVYAPKGARVIEILNDVGVLSFYAEIVVALHGFYFGIVCKAQGGGTKVDLPLLQKTFLREKNILYDPPDPPIHAFSYEERLEVSSLNAEESIRLAITLLRESPPLESIRQAIALLRESPPLVGIHYLLEEHILDRIIPFFSEKLELKSGVQDGMYSSTYLRLAELFRENGDYENAIQFYQKCLYTLPQVNIPVLEKLFQAERLKCKETIKKYLEKYASSMPISSCQKLTNQYLSIDDKMSENQK